MRYIYILRHHHRSNIVYISSSVCVYVYVCVCIYIHRSYMKCAKGCIVRQRQRYRQQGSACHGARLEYTKKVQSRRSYGIERNNEGSGQ